MCFNNKIEGVVVRGNRLGSKLKFPTINLKISKKKEKFLCNGVYGVILFIEGKLHYGVMNIGQRPTINDRFTSQVQVEIHILNFRKLIYGVNVVVYKMFYLREERRFPNLSELKTQIQKDVLEVKTRFGLSKNVPTHTPIMHLPDIMFTKIIDERFGINKGVYNTIDSWFWKKGVTSIKHRRKTILMFLMTNSSSTNKVKIGAGQLTVKLEQYWNEKNFINNQSIL